MITLTSILEDMDAYLEGRDEADRAEEVSRVIEELENRRSLPGRDWDRENLNEQLRP